MNVLPTAMLSNGSDAGPSRGSAAGADKGKDSSFDAMLQGKPAKPATAQASNGTGAPSKDNGRSTPTAPAAEDTSVAEKDGTMASAPADAPPKPNDDATADQAPWPPLGLSALILPAAEPAAAPTTAPADTAAATPAAPLAESTAPALARAPALPGSDKAEAANAEVELPPQALTATKADSDAGQDVDTDPPPSTFSQLLQVQGAQELRASAASNRVDAPTPTPDLHSDDFDDAIGARVSWLAEQKIGHAQIRITPHDLGQVDIKLQLDGDRVHASFSSAHADVRHALESSLPRLREMLGEQGLQLAHADVGQQSQQQAGPRDGSPGSADGPGTADTAPNPTPTLRLRGLLDAYA